MSEHKNENDLLDCVSAAHMDWLTYVGRRLLPEGYWGDRPSMRKQRLFLTFDDGPCPRTTPALLDLLAEEGVLATFFLLGKNVERYPDLAAQIAKAGHQIGNHTYDHLFLSALNSNQIEQQIAATNQAIKETTGSQTTLFRPPYGILDPRGAACLKEQSMQPVYWGVVSGDWLPIGASRVIRRTLNRVRHESLIVLHESKAISQQTIMATREIISRTKEQGYEFHPIGLE